MATAPAWDVPGAISWRVPGAVGQPKAPPRFLFPGGIPARLLGHGKPVDGPWIPLRGTHRPPLKTPSDGQRPALSSHSPCGLAEMEPLHRLPTPCPRRGYAKPAAVRRSPATRSVDGWKSLRDSHNRASPRGSAAGFPGRGRQPWQEEFGRAPAEGMLMITPVIITLTGHEMPPFPPAETDRHLCQGLRCMDLLSSLIRINKKNPQPPVPVVRRGGGFSLSC